MTIIYVQKQLKINAKNRESAFITLPNIGLGKHVGHKDKSVFNKFVEYTVLLLLVLYLLLLLSFVFVCMCFFLSFFARVSYFIIGL
jgi:hypothetical protein